MICLPVLALVYSRLFVLFLKLIAAADGHWVGLECLFLDQEIGSDAAMARKVGLHFVCIV
jgi:hypothetical protein